VPARDRRIILGSLAALAAIAWVYLWFAPMPMPATSGGLDTTHYAAMTFAMWAVMMVGMMVPSVTPAVLLFHRTQRHWRPDGALAHTSAFVGGYLLAWTVFSILATWLQIRWIHSGWIDDMGVASSRNMAAILLIALAIYQWVPAKQACLEHCRSPTEFLTTHHRPGLRGALRMGIHHGLYCVGCCWAVMLLLFVGGVMNLLWVAAVAALVLAEKLFARGPWLHKAIGVAAAIGAVVVLLPWG
jgi:predicted metal-binding membrane protein